MKDPIIFGYSGKPLSQKLGLKPGMKAIAVSPPKEYKAWLGKDSSIISTGIPAPWDFVHLFTNKLADLENQLSALRSEITSNGMVWVSYYKKSSGLPTEITEDLVRETCFPLGFVDIKVCAVSDDWSGLKLVIRKKLR
ncbi:MAG: DUF3052 family protein [Saprospiraceae bacterium]|uniref:DUF3052 family protein n=1 Tax=Candidatus Opimibacter skivensis TaxID=2982028 RepID=A0A9D7SQH5_9BACT|nr:DUF3052 family protein [Candidatus Opimibacter skivensis]